MTIYFLVVLFAPYFNLLCDKMMQKEFRNLILLFALLSFVATAFGWSRKTLGTAYDFLWFIALYFVGAYIKRIGVGVSKLNLFIAWIISLGFSIAMRYIQAIKDFKYEYVTNYNTLFMAIMSVCVFLIFLNTDVKNSILIRFSGLGKYVLGAYLISDHTVIRKQLWAKANLTAYTGLGETILHVISVIIVTMVIGTLIEYFRSKMMKGLVGINRDGLRNLKE